MGWNIKVTEDVFKSGFLIDLDLVDGSANLAKQGQKGEDEGHTYEIHCQEFCSKYGGSQWSSV